MKKGQVKLTRKFGGKLYRFRSIIEYKAEALRRAEGYRNNGEKARIVKVGTDYLIYVR